nr:photosynthetic NDH subunit of subcomplex B 1, chloroplastic [Ipomoea batatas]
MGVLRNLLCFPAASVIKEGKLYDILGVMKFRKDILVFCLNPCGLIVFGVFLGSKGYASLVGRPGRKVPRTPVPPLKFLSQKGFERLQCQSRDDTDSLLPIEILTGTEDNKELVMGLFVPEEKARLFVPDGEEKKVQPISSKTGKFMTLMFNKCKRQSRF